MRLSLLHAHTSVDRFIIIISDKPRTSQSFICSLQSLKASTNIPSIFQMNACYSYLLLLAFAHRLPHASSSSLDTSLPLTNITVQHVCENEVLFLQCPKSSETLQIIRSMYGRTSQRICNHDLTFRFFDKTCANIEQSKHQTKLRQIDHQRSFL